MSVATGVLVLTLALACAACSDTSAGDGDNGSRGDETSDASQITDGQQNAEHEPGADDDGLSSSAPTARECHEADSEEDCLDMGCGVWTTSRVVTLDENGDCHNGAQQEYCLLPQGGDGVPTWWWRKSGEESFVVMMPGAFAESSMEPWQACTGDGAEPAACQCRDD